MMIKIPTEIGVGLSGQIYERMERFGKLGSSQFVAKNCRQGGHNYGAFAEMVLILKHHGFLNDSVGQGMPMIIVTI